MKAKYILVEKYNGDANKYLWCQSTVYYLLLIIIIGREFYNYIYVQKS